VARDLPGLTSYRPCAIHHPMLLGPWRFCAPS